MGLTIITSNPDGHEGTPDRDDPRVYHDHRGKFDCCLASAEALAGLTAPASAAALRPRAADGSPLDPIVIRPVSLDAPDGAILAVHSAGHLEGLRLASEQVNARRVNGEAAALDFSFGQEAAISPGTYAAARSSVAACIEAVALATRIERNPTFALAWPPGHHAEGPGPDGSKDLAMGFCYLSNAAIAAKYARDIATRLDPSRPNRVVVIDIDNHSGNGTTKALANEENLMAVDLRYRSPWCEASQRYVDFRWNPGRNDVSVARQYPYDRNDAKLGTAAHPASEAPNVITLDFWGQASSEERERDPLTRGAGPAALPEEVLERFINEAMPAIRAFAPDVVILSVGLDSAANDPLGGLGFTPGVFYALTRGLRLAFPEAAHVGVLEGGYDPDNWVRCLQPVLLALHENPADEISRTRMFRRYAADFAADARVKAYWEGQRQARP